jgi:hypothetical protein
MVIAREDVHVQVSGVVEGAAVLHDRVAVGCERLLHGAYQKARGLDDRPPSHVVEDVQIADVLLRYHQDMALADGIDGERTEDVLVLEDYRCRADPRQVIA